MERCRCGDKINEEDEIAEVFDLANPENWGVFHLVCVPAGWAVA